MDESYPHLRLEREVPVTEKRKGPGPRPVAPDDPAAHARGLKARVEDALQQTDSDLGGFDDRRLFRFDVAKGFNPDEIGRLSADIELVSQEADTVVVAFVSRAALASFEARLASMAQGDAVSYKQVIYALQGIAGWSAEDRTGWALRREGMPAAEPFLLDLELWPVDARPAERDALWDAFRAWLADNGIETLDGVRQPGLLLQRVRCTRAQAERLLRHRDVRTVDLPPRYGLDLRVLSTDIQNIPPVPSPPEDAPGIAVLDSGLATGHPLLAPAVGDAASFLPGHGPDDEHGHGTHVAGLALYGDVQETLESGAFVPELRLFSGRVLDRNNENETGFVENQVAEAVRYFQGQYGCRVFNLSFGDRNKPYLGGHVRGLALTLDTTVPRAWRPVCRLDRQRVRQPIDWPRLEGRLPRLPVVGGLGPDRSGHGTQCAHGRQHRPFRQEPCQRATSGRIPRRFRLLAAISRPRFPVTAPQWAVP